MGPAPFREQTGEGSVLNQIVTLTVNPAVDVCASIDRIVPSHKLRCRNTRHDAGGGGINVARVVRRFGANPIAVFPAGGPMGQLLEKLVNRESVSHLTIPIAGDTREDVTIDEESTGNQFRFVLPGPPLSEQEARACLDAIAAILSGGSYLVASGSLAPGLPTDFYAQVAHIAAARRALFVLDSSGSCLKAALDAGVHLFKPSLRELEDLVGHQLPNDAACVSAARELIASGKTTMIALTLGERGAILVTGESAFSATAPAAKVVSTVGAGDSFLGAFVWMLAQDKDPRDALRLGVAAGTAALVAPGTELCSPDDVDRLLDDVDIREIR